MSVTDPRLTRVSAALLIGSVALGACSKEEPNAEIEKQNSSITATKLRAHDRRIPGQYVFVFESASVASQGDFDDAIQMAQANDASIHHVYQHALRGFSAEVSEERLQLILQDSRVRYAEENAPVAIVETQVDPPSWGLDRIDQRALPLDQSYSYNSDGTGVNAYVIDTGIRVTHADFGGRASLDFTAIEDGNGPNDCHGHGTHVSGTIGGASYGVAKNVSLHAVRVLDCGGSATFEQVIAGVDWVTANRVLPAVANMSLGGGAFDALDEAVTNSINSGVVYAIAAGNSFGSNACDFSPARTPLAITVGAATIDDVRAGFSNIGTCLDIFAPGQEITSAWNGSDTDTNTISGTSMATPHVAGAAALYLSLHPTATPEEVTAALTVASTADTIQDAGDGSPNRLLYTACVGSTDSIAPTVTLTAPADGAVVNEMVLLSATAADETQLARVEFLVDGHVVGAASSAPYEFSWNSRNVGNGAHVVTARAVDTGCNSASSSANITVDNFIDTTPPSVNITAPADGATITGTIEVDADASDDVGVTAVEFYRDTTLIGRTEVAPYSISWDSTSSPNGSHALIAIAFDFTGNAGTSAAVNVIIDNPGQASYDPTLRAPACATIGSRCDSNGLLIGRSFLGPEPNEPNTINDSCLDGIGGSFHADESLDRLAVTTLDGTDFAPGATVRIDADVWAFSSGDFLDLYYAQYAPNPSWIFIETLPVTGSGPQTLSTTYTLPNGAMQAIRGSFRYLGAPASCTFGNFDDHDDLIFTSQSFGDAIPPSTEIISPFSGSLVTGTVLVQAIASDDVAVAEVQLYDNGFFIASASTPPYEFLWNTSLFPGQVHDLQTRAIDTNGNLGVSSTVTVYVDSTPPFVEMVSPLDGGFIGVPATLQANAFDDFVVDHVDFYVNGSFLTSTIYPYTADWDTTGLSGPQQIYAQAFDGAGNSATSAVVTATIDDNPPSSVITSPATGDTVNGTIVVSIDASDDRGVDHVELFAAGNSVGVAFFPPYQVEWDTSITGNGFIGLVAVAHDIAGNATSSAQVDVVVNNPFMAVFDTTLLAPRCTGIQNRCDTGGLVRGRSSLGPEPNTPNTIDSSCIDGFIGSFHVDESLDRINVVSLDGRDFVVGQRVRVEATVFAYAGFFIDSLDLYYTADANNPSWTYLTTISPDFAGEQVLTAEYDLPDHGGVQAIRAQFRFLGAASECSDGPYDDHDDLIFAVKTPVPVLPSIAASIRDKNDDGTPDSFEAAPLTGGIKDAPGQQENRAILEYNVAPYSGTTITHARLVGRIDALKNTNTGVRGFELAIYNGNGAANLGDYNVAGTVVGAASYHPPADASVAFDLDVTAAVQAQLSSGASHVGLRVRSTTSPNGPNVLAGDTTLIITP